MIRSCAASLLFACALAAFLNACRDTSAVEPVTGQELYDRHGCALCHGPAGRGDGPVAPTLDPPPRDLRDPAAYRVGPTETEIAATIETGILVFRGSGMAPYGHIPLEERQELARYIVSLQTPTPPPAAGEPESP